MPRPATSFRSAGDVPLHYDRLPGQYGSRGQARAFFMTQAFHAKLDACLHELWSSCPLGRAEVVASAGAWVEKPGAHGQGRGFDIDAIFWPEKTFITLHYPTDARFYLGVESVLRRHFGTVLNYEFNAAHHDHFHVDDLAPTGFVRAHRSRVLFVQMAMGQLFGRSVDVDGRWGEETAGVTAAVLEELGLGEVDNPSAAGPVATLLARVWLDFLGACTRTAFADLDAPGARTAADLLRAVHELLDTELADSPARKKIETALTAFVEHEDVAAVLQPEPDPR